MPRLFVPITKVDEAKRQVWGRAVEEIVDNAGEIFDYASSKPHFVDWSGDFEKVTEGKSLGNIRAMHGAVAAGKAIAVMFEDADRAIDIGAEIVDDNEWKKCLAGVYTGFSIGGKYVRKWKDGTSTRYTAKPSEISLVDKPCVPTAQFYEVIKMDGTVAKASFKPQTPEDAVDELAKMLTDGQIKPQRLVRLAKRALARKYDEGDGVLEKPDGIEQDEWDEMTEAEQRQAIRDLGEDITDADRSGKGADGVEKTGTAEEQAAAHNAKVEKIARRLAAADFAKMSPEEQAGRTPEGKWMDYIAPATRELAKVEEGEDPKKGEKETVGDEKDTKPKVDEEGIEGEDPGKKKKKEAGEQEAGETEAEKKAAEKKDITDVQKNMFNVSRFAEALQQLSFVARSAQDDSMIEGDNSPVPAKMRKWIGDGVAIFKGMATEEADELIANLTQVGTTQLLAMAERITLAKTLNDPSFSMARVPELAKAHLDAPTLAKLNGNAEMFAALVTKYGARNSKNDMTMLQQAHDCLAKCGVACAGMGADKTDNGDLFKSSVIAGMQQTIDDLKKSLGDVGELKDRITKLEAQPQPAKGVLRAIAKSEDGRLGDSDTGTPIIKSTPGQHNPEAAEALIKAELTRVGVRTP